MFSRRGDKSMDAYRTPDSELIDGNNRPYKPLRGLLAGLGYTLLLATVISVIWLLLFGLMLGFDLTSPGLEKELAGSPLYMASDLITGAIVLFFGGRAVGTRTPGKELMFGFILAAITIIIYLILMLATESFKTFPLIYNLTTLFMTAVVVPYGSKSTAIT
jgi:peptidoglycan/LPS O-acetylase OafA/YrhL